MSVIINTIGPNSRQIVINGETSINTIVSRINTCLTSLGWNLFDSVTSGANNMLQTRVYSAYNNDSPSSPTTKFMIIRYDAPKGFAYISCAESWNATTHVATNECYIWGRNVPMGIQYSNCVIYVWASQRYAAFMSVIRGNNGPWQGVFEFEREAVEDTAAAGYPCFGWTSSVTIANPNSVLSYYTTNPIGFSVPRTRDGFTGWGAAQQFVIQTNNGTYPPTASVVPFGGSANTMIDNNCGTIAMYGRTMGSYVWNQDKKHISSMKLIGANTMMSVGRIYGLKVTTTGSGNILDVMMVPTDSNGFFTETGGTATVHSIVGVQSGIYQKTATGTTPGSMTLTTASTGLTASNGVMVRGKYIFACGYNTINSVTTPYLCRINLDTGLPTGIPLFGTPGTTNWAHDIVYDGGNYVYASTPTGIAKVHVDTNEVTQLPIFIDSVSVGTKALAIDDTYLYAGEYGSTTTTRIIMIDLASFSMARVFTPTLQTNAHSICSLESADYNGYIVGVMINNGASSANKIVSVKGSDAYGIILGSPSNISNNVTGASIWWDGNDMVMLFYTSTTHLGCSVNPITLDISAPIIGIGAGAGAGLYGSGATVNKTLPFRGARMHWANHNYKFNIWPVKSSTNVPAINYMAQTVGINPLSTVIWPTSSSYVGLFVTDGCAAYIGQSSTLFMFSNLYNSCTSDGTASSGCVLING